MRANSARQNEAGNAFVYIFLGIALFAALMFTFSRSARQGGDNMNKHETEIVIADLLAYTQRLERRVNSIMGRGDMSESYISFENDFEPLYVNAACNAQPDPEKCKVFSTSAGGVEWQAPPDGINDGSAWIFTGTNQVPDIGNDASEDLILFLDGLDHNTCVAINDKLGVANPGDDPPQDVDGIDLTKFTGSFAVGEVVGAAVDLSGVNAACVALTTPNPDEYVFYAVLMAR